MSQTEPSPLSRLLITVVIIFVLLCGCGSGAQQVSPENETEQVTETTSEAASGSVAESTSESVSEITEETGQLAETAVTETYAPDDQGQEVSESEAALQNRLSQTYGASVGRVSLDEELFETHMGDTGQRLAEREGELSDYQLRILDACAFTPAAGAHYCAAWISSVCENAGIYGVGGNANDMWAYICYSSDLDELAPGMIIAVQHSRTDQDSAGYIYGHVGIYIGGGYVIQSTTVEGEGEKVITSLDDWFDRYDPYDAAKWGYPGS